MSPVEREPAPKIPGDVNGRSDDVEEALGICWMVRGGETLMLIPALRFSMLSKDGAKLLRDDVDAARRRPGLVGTGRGSTPVPKSNTRLGSDVLYDGN